MIDSQRAALSESEDQAAAERLGVSFAWILAVLLSRRRAIITLCGVGFALAVAIALLKPPSYTSSFSFVPQTGQDQSRNGLASLAGQLGISVAGSTQPPQFYADLLSTRDVLESIARDSVAPVVGGPKTTPLSAYLGVHASDPSVKEEMTLDALRSRVITANAATRTTGVVTATVTTKSPEVSFEIAQNLVDALNRFNIQTRKSQAGEERRFTEGRLNAAKDSLRAAEDAMQAFLSANRQFGSSPQLTFQRDRLQREVSLQQQVVVGLTQQYEDARIREVRDTPVITIVEQPALPALPDPRRRALLIATLTILALFAGCAYSIARAGWERQREMDSGDPAYSKLAAEWQTIRKSLGRS